MHADIAWQLDDAADTQDIDAARLKLESYLRDQNVLTFTDPDGNTVDALVWDLNFNWHTPGLANEPFEGRFRISILEVADE